MKNRIMTLILAITIVFLFFFTFDNYTLAAALYDYDSSKAIEYAKNNWNNGVGECAHFVSKCVQTGGLSIPTRNYAVECRDEIEKITGIKRQTLVLDANGYVSKSLNKGIIEPGDVVLIYCPDHSPTPTSKVDSVPHIMLVGKSSTDRVTYYAHNSAQNNKAFPIKGSNFGHANCKVEAQVIHFTGNNANILQQPPTPPTGLTATKASDKTAKISWNAVSGATSYEVQYQNQSGTWKSDPDYKTKTATSYTSTGLGTYDSYNFRVRSVNSAGKSDWATITYKKNASALGTTTIQYSANGGNGAPSSHSVTKDSSGVAKFNLSTTKPTRSGYTFLGWRLDNNASASLCNPGQSMSVTTGNAKNDTTITYYAQWNISTNACKHPSYNSSGYCATCGAEYSINFTAKKETFYTNKDGVPIRSRPYSTNAIIVNISKGTQVDVVGSGKNSLGNLWYKIDDGTWIYSENLTKTKPANTTTGIATIQYNANGGSGAPSSHSVTKDSSGGARFNLSTTKPTRNGYTFLGWRLENSSAYGIDSPGQSIAIGLGSPTSNATLAYYAQWEVAKVSTTTNGTATVQYNANGGSGAPGSHSTAMGSNGQVSFTLSSTIPTRSGSTFLGWRIDNSGWLYSPGERVSFSMGNTNNITVIFYAQWSFEAPVVSPTTDVPANYKPRLAGGGSTSDDAFLTMILRYDPSYPITELGYVVTDETGSTTYYNERFSTIPSSGEHQHRIYNVTNGKYYISGYVIINGIKYQAYTLMASVYDPW